MAAQPPKSTLLLVDDRPENLLALQAVLQDDGYALLTAHSGPEALQLIAATPVDLVLLDIQMPGMDGYETAKRIKQLENGRELPIIFVTAIFTENPHIKRGFEAGGIDYFTKPFDPDILKMKVAIYVSFRQKEVLLKEREKRIRESEELLEAGRKLSAILETLSVGVVIADIDGRIIQTNDTMLRMCHSVEPVQSDLYGQLLAWWNSDGHAIKEMFSQVLGNGMSTNNKQLELRGLDGAVRIVQSSVSPLRGLDDRIVGAVAVIQDLTQRKKIEEDMEQRIMKLVSIGVEFEQRSRQ